VRTNNAWEDLEKRKPRSLREKFEVQKAMWREGKNLKYLKIEEAQEGEGQGRQEGQEGLRADAEGERSQLSRSATGKRKAEAKEAAEAGEDAAKQTRVQKMLSRAKQRPH